MNIVEIREHDGERVLAVSTGMTARAFAQSKMSLALSSRGFLFRPDGTVEPWIPEGTFCEEIDGRDMTWIFGKAIEGETLVASTGGNRENAWKALHASVSAISRAFVENKITDAELTSIAAAGPGAIIGGEDGNVLALPSDIYIRCIGAHGEEAEIENRLLWIHPDHRTLNPSWAFSFMAGTLAYRIAAGVAPYGRLSGTKRKMSRSEEIALDMRNGLFEPVDVAVWAIRPAAAACINALVSTKVATSTDTLVSFGPEIGSVIDPAKESIPESEEFAAAREAKTKKLLASARTEDFFRRYRITFRVGIIVLVLAGALVGTFIHDVSSKPDTFGLTPEAVISNYYRAIAEMDQEVPRGYMVKGLKTGYDDYVTNLYVTSKVRATYEGAGVISPAQLYLAKEPGKGMIYGTTRLALGDVRVSGNKAESIVSFYYWIPLSAENEQNAEAETDAVQLSVYDYCDRITLEWVKDRWKISDVGEIRRTLVVGDGEKLLESIAEGKAGDLPFAPSPEDIAAAEAAMKAQEY